MRNDFVELSIKVGNESVDSVALVAKKVGNDCLVIVDYGLDVMLDIRFVVEETVDY